MRSKISLDSSREVAQGCGVSFVNYLHLVPLIISQNFCATYATSNQIEPEWRDLSESASQMRIDGAAHAPHASQQKHRRRISNPLAGPGDGH